MSRRAWVLVLTLWFLIDGLLIVTNLVIAGSGYVLGFLALAVAVLIFLDARTDR